MKSPSLNLLALLALTIVVLCSRAAYAGTANGRVTQISTNTVGYVEIFVEAYSGNTCSRHAFWVDITTSSGRDFYNAIMAAYVAARPVWVTGTGICNAANDEGISATFNN